MRTSTSETSWRARPWLASQKSDNAGTGDLSAFFPLISPDGRYVLVTSFATNLVPGDTNAAPDLFVRDLQSGTTEAISVKAGGSGTGNAGIAYHSTIHPVEFVGGRFVLFGSQSSNLVANDPNGFVSDVFLRDIVASTTRLVSGNRVGTGTGDDASVQLFAFQLHGLALSADGNVAVFSSTATDLVAGDLNRSTDIFTRDVSSGVTTLVTTHSPAIPTPMTGRGISSYDSMSADGRYVVFTSSADDLVPGDTNHGQDVRSRDVFVRDLQTGLTRLVDASSAGQIADADSHGGRISADGRFVAFVSRATNLVPGVAGFTDNIYVKDLITGGLELISPNSGGTDGGNSASFAVESISADGRFVAFASFATNLAPNFVDGNARGEDLYVRDRTLHTTELVTLNGTGTASANAGLPVDDAGVAMSSDGRYVVLDSDASDLVAGDTSGQTDVFVRDLVAGKTRLVSIDRLASAPGNGRSVLQAADGVSPDVRYIVFESTASNLTADPDTNGAFDVFVRDLQAAITTLVSSDLAGIGTGDLASERGVINIDGSRVAFASNAGNLTSDATNAGYDVFVRELSTHTTWLVTVPIGSPGTGIASVTQPLLSADGQTVAFLSPAGNLTTGDANGLDDLFVRDLQHGRTALVSLNRSGTASVAEGVSQLGLGLGYGLSTDGRVAVFVCSSPDVVAGDLSSSDDVFAGNLAVTAHSISGQGFDDVSHNGTRDAGEGGLAAVTVFLDANADGNLDPSEVRAQRDGGGLYSFPNLAAGSFTVVIVPTNTGYTDVPAPLARLTADNAVLSLPDQDDFVGRSVQFLAANFADGQTEQVVTIPILGDGQVGPDRQVDLELSTTGDGAILGAPATATLVIRNTDSSPPPPPPQVTVINTVFGTIKLTKPKMAPIVDVTFSAPIDTAGAQSSTDYRLVAAGRDKKFGTRDDKAVPLGGATYNAQTRTVRLTLRGQPPKARPSSFVPRPPGFATRWAGRWMATETAMLEAT